MLGAGVVGLCGTGAHAVAGTDAAADIRYGPVPAWASPVPTPTAGPTPPDAPLRIAYLDNQVRVVPAGEEVFSAYRLTVLKPDALSAGNVTVTWMPSAGSATVHYLRLIRDGQASDVLAGTKFTILQREAGLEQSMLDGERTATLQVPGLRVGDTLEFAVTTTRREPAFGTHVAGIGALPGTGIPGAYRYRLVWPAAKALTWRASSDLAPGKPTLANGEKAVAFELRDPAGALPTEGAPARYNVRRLIEYSDFARWSDVSRQMWPLYDRAVQAAAGVPLRAEAAKIAALSSDPAVRAAAALRLVQDDIRYVYVGLDGGNYRSATVAETWQRRFGDCKAKTVLLLALLRELGIAAEPVLVSATGGDGTDARLPSPRMFDHVLVRAQIAGKTHWLDGTRAGDRYLDTLPPPAFRWALPLSAAGAELAPVAARAPDAPSFVGVIDIDARAGLDKDAKVTARNILRGDEAYQMRARVAAMAAEDADRAIKAYWRQQIDWMEPDKVGWTYDERRAAFAFTATGTGKPGWTGTAAEGRSLTLVGAGFYAPDQLRRPKEQDQSAPWAIEYPRYRCWATTVRLPADDAKWRWAYSAKPVDRHLGGVAYWRQAGLNGGVMRSVMSRRSYVPEISPADAATLNGQIANFDNNMSSVYQIAATAGAKPSAEALPFRDDADFVVNPAPCLEVGLRDAGGGRTVADVLVPVGRVR
ncbi:DUF3857 domain-containing protein [Sphingomonas donggukensis]|uniref:DUF3857 domain-containing protein n=1 Tax=Sphingomonas donggukensis TaxID=2949093 RepID=A0ABY4U0V6_9SPHN|nr:DUF3857 domain-containing protein [Sphingomonas donggukensis]URW76999.1 DUF3857 domain-containing protein [Sphingomonas donggukensis]